ncbi:MAG: radical SAM protein [Planctomycetes bacterium]|nr:radical SAM protein [Planctomycetota bacterium]
MSFLESRLYKAFYDVIRKNKTLNHLAHKIIQSERMRKFPFYRNIYDKIIEKKSAQYMNAPNVIEFEITNKCNSNCIMCPPEVHLGNDFIDHELFKRIAKEGRELGIRRMVFTGGEPLLDKLIFDKIKYAKELGYTYVHMFTNGSLLIDSFRENLLKSGLDSLTISFDSAIKEEYEKIRAGLNYDKTVNNIKSLCILKKKLKSDIPIVRINMVALPENLHSRRFFIQTFRGFADIVEIIDEHNFAGSVETDFSTREYSQTSRDPCHILFIKACITPTGCLKKCSIDHTAKAEICDLRTTSFKDAVYSERLVKIKKDHLLHTFSESGCTNCTQRESWWVDY